MFLRGIFAWLLLLGGVAYPCASCGSGGDDPLILYPNEDHKFFLGQANTFNIKNVTSRGDLATAGGPSMKNSLTAAYGERIGRDIFATVTMPLIRNHLESNDQVALGDPSLSARYTIFLPSIIDPNWMPQVQLVGGFKFASSRSIHETQDPKTLLDVYGTGFHELRVGLDVWSGNAPVKMGFAVTVVRPLDRLIHDVTYQPGLIVRSTLTAGYDWTQGWHFATGLVREFKASALKNGVAADDSISHNIFLNQDWDFSDVDRVRFSYVETSALFENRNGVHSQLLALSYMRAL